MKTISRVKKGYFKVILLLIGSMIGAGFITGSEIWHFFARFSGGMFVGLLFFGVLLFVLVYSELKAMHDVSNNLIRGEIWLKETVNFFSELIIASAMISGIKEVVFNLSTNAKYFVLFLAIIVIFIILFKGIKMFSFYNYFVVLFVLFVLLVLLTNFGAKADDFKLNFTIIDSCKSCIYAGLYVFMNISALKPILRNERGVFSQKQSLILSMIFSFFMCFFILVFSLFLIKNEKLLLTSMPLKTFFLSYGKSYEIIFFAGMIFAMVSTCISCSLGVKEKFIKKSSDNLFSSLCSLILILIFGFIPFRVFVIFFYPLIGFFNLLIFVFEIFKN